MILSVTWSVTGASTELTCGELLDKCSIVVGAQKETITKQSRLIKSQAARIKLSDNRIEELEEDVDLYKKSTGISILTIIMILL